jgi:hypothetical protein
MLLPKKEQIQDEMISILKIGDGDFAICQRLRF